MSMSNPVFLISILDSPWICSEQSFGFLNTSFDSNYYILQIITSDKDVEKECTFLPGVFLRYLVWLSDGVLTPPLSLHCLSFLRIEGAVWEGRWNIAVPADDPRPEGKAACSPVGPGQKQHHCLAAGLSTASSFLSACACASLTLLSPAIVLQIMRPGYIYYDCCQVCVQTQNYAEELKKKLKFLLKLYQR